MPNKRNKMGYCDAILTDSGECTHRCEGKRFFCDFLNSHIKPDGSEGDGFGRCMCAKAQPPIIKRDRILPRQQAWRDEINQAIVGTRIDRNSPKNILF